MSHLISYKSIRPNLRKTASKGLISLLNHQQLEDLAFKYFGIKDEYGNIIGYQCPYSGKVYTNYKDIVLEHIIPVASNGGTVLFNCIPTSEEVNGTDQKGAKHLIAWWTNSKFWDKDAPLRLEKIVNYMLDGYEQVFTEYTIDEVESSYLDIESDDSILEEEDNPNINARTEKQLLKQAKNNGIHSYLGFINDCINALEKYNINTSSIKERLQHLQDKNIFKDINKYQIYQNIIQKLIISRIGDNNSSYLTYTLNFDIKKLMDLINLDNEQDIYNELNLRLTNIEQLLKDNNLSIAEYFKSLKDIQDVDIIYKNINNISPQELNIFLENIKIGIDTKINIFIEMLNEGNSEILKRGNTEILKGYPSINVSSYWSRHQDKIKCKLFEELKANPKYDVARQTVLTYFKVKTYEELVAKQELDIETKINIYIEMLNEGNGEILKRENTQTLKGYPSIIASHYWRYHQDKIKQKLFIELKNDHKYDIARKTILTYFKVKTYEELVAKQELDIETKINIYIEMLNEGNSEILKRGNTEALKGYPSINVSYYWYRHQDKIKQKLFIELKNDPKYDTARKTILTYFKVKTYEELPDKQGLDLETKLSIYIEMLNEGNSEILKQGNTETLKGYPSIHLSHYWGQYKDKIKCKLFEEQKNNPKYDVARQTVLTYFEVKTYEELVAKYEELRTKQKLDLETKLSIYIEMLNEGNSEILKGKNTETLKGHPSINVSHYWSQYQDKIKRKLFEEQKNNPKYDVARQTVLTYFEVKTYEELVAKYEKLSATKTLDLETKLSIYIEMLNEGNSEILKQKNKKTLKGYPSINISQYWSQYQDKIKQKLFIELKDNPEYDRARQTVLTYFKVSTYEELVAKQNKGKKLKEAKKMKQELVQAIKYVDEIEVSKEEQRKRA